MSRPAPHVVMAFAGASTNSNASWEQLRGIERLQQI